MHHRYVGTYKSERQEKVNQHTIQTTNVLHSFNYFHTIIYNEFHK